MTLSIGPLPENAAPPVPDGGLGALSTGRGNLPLDSVDVHAALTGLAAAIEVVQGFHNPYDVPLEATYVFPLPDRAAVTALRMETADRTVEGVLKERGEARQAYDHAIAAGRRAAIAEEDRPDVFTMRVGNIPPGERVTIRLTLNQPLPFEVDASDAATGAGTGSATFRFPLVVAPRYIPGAPLEGEQAGDGVAADTDAVPDASRISPPVLLPGFPLPVRLSITVDIDPAGLALTGLRSALHVVAEEESGGRTRIRLLPGERLNRDFILRLDFAAGPSSEAALTLTPDSGTETGAEGTFTLTLLPSGEARPRPRDIVLLLDRSGSMDGWKMVAARRAAGRIVDTFTALDRFAVLSFDHMIETPRDLHADLVPGTDRNRFRAVEHLAGLKARGGTEMLPALEKACALLTDTSRDRVLVLITDGQVGNEDQILAGLVPRLRGARVHTVGIDRAVNAGFLGRLADAGRGRFELVESEDRLDEAMERIHHRIGSPLVTDLRLEAADGLRILPDTVAPERIGALYPGVPLVVSGRFAGPPSGSIVVRGTASDGTAWERRAAGTQTRTPAASAIWARAHLRDLEDRYAITGSQDLERRIVDTSLRFNVLCRFTAFVAEDSKVVTDGHDRHHVVQPVERPSDWELDTPDFLANPPAPGSATPYGAAAPAAPAAPAAMPRPMPMPMPRPMPMSPAGPGPMRPGGLGGPGYRSAPPPGDWMEAEQSRGAGARSRSGGAFGRGGSKPRKRRRKETLLLSERTLAEARGRVTTLLKGLKAMATDTPEARQAYLLGTVLPTLTSIIELLKPGGEDNETSIPLTVLWLDLNSAAGRVGTEVPAQADPDFTRLWNRTLEILETFVGEAPEDKPRRREFWKRSR